MISASVLDGLLTVMKKHGTNVLRYKTGTGDTGEEIEIIIPANGLVIEDDDEDSKKNSSGGPKLNLIGFHVGEDEVEEED